MTSKQRVLTAINHQQPDRVPVDYGAHGAVNEALLKYLGTPRRDRPDEAPGD